MAVEGITLLPRRPTVDVQTKSSILSFLSWFGTISAHITRCVTWNISAHSYDDVICAQTEVSLQKFIDATFIGSLYQSL